MKAPPAAPDLKGENKSVGEAATAVGETGKDVADRADKIDEHADAISEKTPPEAKTDVQPEIKGIKDETKGLRQDSAALSATEQKLRDTESRLVDQQKAIDNYTAYAKNSEAERAKLQTKIKELESSNAKMLRTMLSWIVVICVIGIGASLVIGFFFKTPAAFMVAAGCVATMGVAVAVTMYLQQIAWVALAVLGVGFVGAVWYVFTQIRNRDRAVHELVHTGEVAKTYLPSQVREKIFGNSVEPGIAHSIQSDSTINLVRNARNIALKTKKFGLAPSMPSFWKPTAGDAVSPPAMFADPYSAVPVPTSAPAGRPQTILG
jgi:ABC-type multidrug transport system fused ATPase/permease subunit